MTEFGIDVKKNVENKLLNIVQIPKEFEEYEEMIMDKVKALPQDVKIRVVSTHYFDFNSEKKTCLLYTSPSPRDLSTSRMPSSA